MLVRSKRFHPGPSFAKRNRKVALRYSQFFERNGQQNFIVEEQHCFTVWHLTPHTAQETDLEIPRSSGEQDTGPLNQEQDTGLLNQDFIDRCEQELAICIGPIAKMIIQQSLAQAEGQTPGEFLDAIASNIPNPQLAQTFRDQLQ